MASPVGGYYRVGHDLLLTRVHVENRSFQGSPLDHRLEGEQQKHHGEQEQVVVKPYVVALL